MQKIMPNLWFDNNAEAAVAFYTSLFKNSNKGFTARYGAAAAKVSGMPEGSVLTVEFQLEGQDFVALSGGPVFKFTPAVSFYVNRKTKEEVDRLWKKLVEGGSVLMELAEYPFSKWYGWLQDKYGLSWQLILGDESQKIVPCLLYVGKVAGKAEEAMKLYTSIFPDSRIGMISRYEEGGPDPGVGTVNYGAFSVAGQNFVAMDSSLNHQFTFNEAISLQVDCKDQEEIDYYWEKLIAGGEESVCGWLKDKFGVSWQVTPTILTEMMKNPDNAKVERMMKAFLEMKKIDIAGLKKAFEGK